MEEKKTIFIVKAKNAITKFDEYEKFSEEKLSKAFKYFFKLLLAFVTIIAIALTGKVIYEGNKAISNFKDECPEFSFKDYVLEINGDNKKIIKGDNVRIYRIYCR